MGVETQLKLETALGSLLRDYRDLQAPRCSVLERPPSALEALRMVHATHPTLIRDYQPLKASSRAVDWDDAETYSRVVNQRDEGQDQSEADREACKVGIAITDDGLADSVRFIQTPDGPIKAFVKPLEEQLPIETFLERLRDPNEPEMLYLQSQDGNIYRTDPREGGEQLKGMRRYIARDVQWMKEAVGTSADAVNLWIGSERSSTTLHHDPYDNIYHVLSGTKTFTLISPIEGLWLDERFFPPATLIRDPSTGIITTQLDPPPRREVPWVESSVYPKPIEPIIVTVQKGETLFLPAGWWHAVDQKEGPGGVAVAVNYWYDRPLHPQYDALLSHTQRSARIAGREGVIRGDDLDIASDSDSDSLVNMQKGHGAAEKGRDASGSSPSDPTPMPDIWGASTSSDEEEEERWDPAEWRKQREEAKAKAAAQMAGAQ